MRLHGLTAPDPRPYAGPTDLVTAADVAEWLRERAERALLGNCHPPTHVLHYALVDLRARLDRERRQACERGAEECERQAAEYASEAEKYRAYAADPDGAPGVPANSLWFARVYDGRAETYRERAIAFRAAARQP